MKKVIMALLLVVFCMSLFAMENEKWVPTLLTGSGTELSPYLIEDYADLVILSTNSSFWGIGKYLKQTADIDASASNSGSGFSPIGSSSISFQGNYDGQGYTISDLFMSRSAGYQGLFGKCQGANIQNIALVNVNVTGTFYTGGLAGNAINATIIENCFVSGNVTGRNYVGGLVGGLQTSSQVNTCFATCPVTGSTNSIGGLIGIIQSSSTVFKSFATGNVVATTSMAGGLIGYVDEALSITQCFAEGDVSSNDYAGGLVGYLYGDSNTNRIQVTDCYATGGITTNTFGAGFIAFSKYANIDNCYSVGSVAVADGGFLGGLTANSNNYCTATNSYWNTTTAGVTTSELGTGKTTTEMQSLATYTDNGWDFVDETVNGEEDVWSIDSAKNDGYPYLSFAQNYFQYVPVCPHVTNRLPEDGDINQTLDEVMYWDAIPEVEGYTRGYEVTLNNGTPIDQIETSFVPVGGLEFSTEYTWSVKPYYLFNGTVKIYPDTAPEVYNFYTAAGVIPETPNEENPVESVLIRVPNGGTPNVPVVLATLPTEGYEYQPIAAITYDFNVDGVYMITIDIPLSGEITYHVYIGGRELVYEVEWIMADGGITIGYDYDGSKGEKDIVITNNDDFTLPVELSSFNAVITSANYAQINWETASESNLIGYNIYRNEAENSATAQRVNANIIAANNYATGSKYSFVDSELETETTYYYWLESLELSNENNLYGPVSVRIEDDAVIEGITATQFNNFGPSPFTDATSTSLRVKEGESASVTIYNLLGQVVSRESFNAGEHNFTFNGKDLNNKKVANGIYFVKMSSPSASKSFKIVKIK